MKLLGERRFAPFFWTQLPGAFNDSLFKNALMIMLAFKGVNAARDAGLLMDVAAGLSILPFF